MATIIIKASDLTSYLLEGNKLVTLSGQPQGDLPSLTVNDATFTRLTTAYGPIVT